MTKDEVIDLIESWANSTESEFVCSEDERRAHLQELRDVIEWINSRCGE